jgi:hypothetical protein
MPNRRPAPGEADTYYFKYITLVASDDVRSVLAAQHDEMHQFFRTISEETSHRRYAPGKWSIRQVVGHMNDCERVFAFRALWFARGFVSSLPSFDQNVAAEHDMSGDRPWRSLIGEFLEIRASTLSFFNNLPVEAWSRRGTASGHEFTVRALAYITAGHVIHHTSALRGTYLAERMGSEDE